MGKKHFRKRDRNKRSKFRQRSSPDQPPTIQVIGITEPMDTLFYKPGRCALCQCKASESMVGITWQGQSVNDPLSCYFCPHCAFFFSVYATVQQQVDFMLNAEMHLLCELAQESAEKVEVGK